MKDNAVANVHSQTQFVTPKFTTYTKGSLTLDHRGAFIAKFRISWDEISFDESGDKKVKHCYWRENDRKLTAGFHDEIFIPANAENICIEAYDATGLIWEPWNKIIDCRNLSNVMGRKILVQGTTLKPKISVSPDRLL